MASTYSSILRLELITTGEQAGTWGTTTNTNLGTLIEASIAGTATHSTAGAGDTTLSVLNGSADEARAHVLKLTGALTGSHNVICPSVSKTYLVYNATSGAYTVTLKTAAGTGVVIPQGSYMQVYCDGTNVVNVNVDGQTHAAASKATPVDADELPLADSAASFSLKKLTWANLKATLATTFASRTGATFTGGINEARGTVVMHATTMDLWAQPNIIDGTTSAVTITAIVNAPQAGARRTLYPYVGTTITHGATFSVDGNASYTTLAGDALVFEAVTVSTYNVGVIKQDGTPVANNPTYVPVRQTVLQGPVDTSGLPTFLPATSGNLNLTSQNVSTGANALVMTAAQGANLYGAINAVGQSTSNLTWTGCTANQTNYLPVLVNADGTLTPQTPVILAPIYQWGGTPSVTANQYTFNIQQMTMYKGNGSTAPAVNHVIAGEAVAGASTITSTVAYAYLGRYDSGYTNTLIGTSSSVSKNHNIGETPRWANLVIKNLTTEAGFSVGELVDGVCTSSASTSRNVNIAKSRTAMSYSTETTYAHIVVPKTGGSGVSLTAANWAYALQADRGW